jgi:hypothetical protein
MQDRTSKWAGYSASLFAILAFVTMTTYRQFNEKLPDWLPMVLGWLMILAAISGVICLVSAIFAFFRRTR